MKQTAVEWLVEELNNIKVWTKNDIILQKADILIEQAKEMEKQQIIDASNQSYLNSDLIKRSINNKKVKSVGEQYHNETYNK